MSDETSLDFLIACIIRESEKKDNPIWFNKLENVLKGRASRATISKNLDKLFDYGIVNGAWDTNNNGDWVRTLHISGEATELMNKISEEHKNDEDVIAAYARLNEEC